NTLPVFESRKNTHQNCAISACYFDGLIFHIDSMLLFQLVVAPLSDAFFFKHASHYGLRQNKRSDGRHLNCLSLLSFLTCQSVAVSRHRVQTLSFL
ncbi:MAG: hypothetical protein ACRDCC_01770, partial [Culicoidibacterales bacterium]